jgi:hypothetical protein
MIPRDALAGGHNEVVFYVHSQSMVQEDGSRSVEITEEVV